MSSRNLSKSRNLMIVLLMTISFTNSPHAQATSFAESYRSMIDRADLIIIGPLKEIKSFEATYSGQPYAFDKDKTVEITGLFTENVFSIDKVLKGSFSKPIIGIRQRGGQNGDVLMSPSGGYYPYLETQYVIVAIKSDLFPGKWVSASGGQGVFEQYQLKGVTYLRNLNRGAAIKMQGDPESVVELDISLCEVLNMIAGQKSDC